MTPVDAHLKQLLRDLKEHLYNPFEPDNQSKIYHRVVAALGEEPKSTPFEFKLSEQAKKHFYEPFYWPPGTVTGRVSHSEPEMQNILIRTEEGRKIRDTFVEQSNALVQADFSEIEGRILAHMNKVDTSKMIFVFGSNEAGIHGAGAAKYALTSKGAMWGYGFGLAGNSYAIPTKDTRIRTLPIETVRRYVDNFLRYASEHPGLTFQVTAIGCGLAGFKHEEIAPMFIGAPDNCYFDELWRPWLDNVKFWGTF